MKKLYILLGLFLLSGSVIGCSSLFSFTTTEKATYLTSAPTTTLTTTSEASTGSYSVDENQLKSDIYAMIYEEVYNDIRDEVTANLSEERFDAIYADVVSNLLDKVIAGEITVSSETIVDMIKSVESGAANSVIGVSNLDSTGEVSAIGSGIIYKHTGTRYFVVTNQHVVEGGTNYEIEFADGSTIAATLKGVDELVDVAVLYFDSENLYPTANFADSSLVSKGDLVLAVGNPNGYEFYRSMTMGIVSGTDRFFDIDGDDTKDMFVNYIQHDAAINAGNSGGALFDINGDVIGINVIKIASTDVEGMGFAIPSNLVSAICSDIEEYGFSLQKPVLGITFLEINGNETYLASQGYEIPEGITDGFYIISVISGASLDGYVQAGDILTEIAGIQLGSSQDFVFEFSQYHVGDIISVVVYRNGGYVTIDNIELLANPG